MIFEIRELKMLIERVCDKNICRATKEMALSHLATLEVKFKPIPTESQHGREPDKVKPECKTCKGFKDKYCIQTGTMIPCPDCQKVKPLAQYLSEYIYHHIQSHGQHICIDVHHIAYESWSELLQQALDAYESTEQVKIRIE